jgi:hypothetical protein
MNMEKEQDDPLQFQYKTVIERLPASPRLTRKTFRALRQDGILYLIDANTDTYLLLSRRVLEPFARVRDRPDLLAKVPQARLDFIRRTSSSK